MRAPSLFNNNQNVIFIEYVDVDDDDGMGSS